MNLESDGALVFLLFIPLLWVLWLWVYHVFFQIFWFVS